MTHFHFILLLGFVIGAQACCQLSKAPKKSIHCDKCKECLRPYASSTWKVRSMPNLNNLTEHQSRDLWCNNPICGTAYYAATKCQLTYEGFLAVDGIFDVKIM